MRKLLLSLFTVVAALSMANAGEVTFDLTKPDLFGFARCRLHLREQILMMVLWRQVMSLLLRKR